MIDDKIYFKMTYDLNHIISEMEKLSKKLYRLLS